MLQLVCFLWLQPTPAQSAEADAEVVPRPEWSIGDWWELRTQGGPERLTVVAREADQYVLVATSVGVPGRLVSNATRLYADRDGWVTRRVRPNGEVTETDYKLEWVNFPLHVGKSWSFFVNTPTLTGKRAHFAYYCRADRWESIDVGTHVTRALRIGCQQRGRDVRSMNSQVVWYAPEAKRVVKLTSDFAGGWSVEVLAWGTASPTTPPAITSTPPTSPEVVRPGSAAPLIVVVLEPKPGAVVQAESSTLKVEVRGQVAPTALRVSTTGHDKTYKPGALKRGDSWILDIVVPLTEGANEVRLEAADESGGRSASTLTLIRETLGTVEFRGPPRARVRLNDNFYVLGVDGTLVVRLPAGSYELEVSKEGFVSSALETLRIVPGEVPLRKQIVLKPLGKETPAKIASPSAPPAAPPALDTEAPKIVINYPGPDIKVERETIVLTGLVTDNVEVGRVQIAVNGIEITESPSRVIGKGYPIRVSVSLLPGDNLIEITAADQSGNVAQAVRTVTRVVRTPSATSVPVRETWAVVVGIGRYENTAIPTLRYSVADAEAVYDVLVGTAGVKKDHVILLTDRAERKATLRNIKWALGTFLARSAKKDDTVLIFFAGHGAPEIDQRGIERDGLAKYVIPADADPEDLFSSALPMDDIQTIFGRIEAERVVMFLDACYSGAAGGRTFLTSKTRGSAIDDLFLERLTRSKGRAILTAARPTEVAVELQELGHGLFTYYLVQGLQGAADANRDGIVTLQELYEYLEQQVSRKSRAVGANQHPVMKGELEGVLPLTKIGAR